MTLQEAISLAQEGTKMTHKYFTPEEYMTMRGNIIIFEDGAEIYIDEWTEGKPYLLDGWEKFEN